MFGEEKRARYTNPSKLKPDRGNTRLILGIGGHFALALRRTTSSVYGVPSGLSPICWQHWLLERSNSPVCAIHQVQLLEDPNGEIIKNGPTDHLSTGTKRLV